MTAGSGPGPPTSIVPPTGRAPHSSTMSFAATRLALERRLGREPLLEAPGRLRAQAEPGRRALDVRAVPVRGLHEDARGGGTDLRARAAHDPGEARRAVGVLDQAHVGVERALDVVERRRRVSPARARRTVSVRAGHEVGVEGVHGLAREQHRVVRDVDDVGDGALAGRHQPRLQPRRRRRDRHVLVGAQREARAQVGVLDPHREARARRRRRRVAGPRRRAQRRPGGGVDLARDAVDAEAVGPVRRDLELEDVGGDRQDAGERRARLGALVEDDDPRVVGADAELVLGEDHPVGDLAAQLGALEARAAGQHRARPRDRHELAGGDVRRAAHDRDRLAAPHVHDADAQPVGLRMASGAQHAPDDEVLERGRAVRERALDLRAGHRQALLERGRGRARDRSRRAAIRRAAASAELLQQPQVVLVEQRAGRARGT